VTRRPSPTVGDNAREAASQLEVLGRDGLIVNGWGGTVAQRGPWTDLEWDSRPAPSPSLVAARESRAASTLGSVKCTTAFDATDGLLLAPVWVVVIANCEWIFVQTLGAGWGMKMEWDMLESLAQ
jgi:hypothetical protein